MGSVLVDATVAWIESHGEFAKRRILAGGVDGLPATARCTSQAWWPASLPNALGGVDGLVASTLAQVRSWK